MVALGAQSCSAASALSRVIIFPFVAVHGGLLGLLATVQASLYPLWEFSVCTVRLYGSRVRLRRVPVSRSVLEEMVNIIFQSPG